MVCPTIWGKPHHNLWTKCPKVSFLTSVKTFQHLQHRPKWLQHLHIQLICLFHTTQMLVYSLHFITDSIKGFHIPHNLYLVIFTALCPKIFKTIPVGIYKGQIKYWPWFWLIVPVYVYLTPLSFGISMIFDRKHFVEDMKTLKAKIMQKIEKLKTKTSNN